MFTTFDFQKTGTSRFELFCEIDTSTFGTSLITTGKDIESCVSILRPGVDGEMALCDHDNAADSVGIKGMKDGFGASAERAASNMKCSTRSTSLSMSGSQP